MKYTTQPHPESGLLRIIAARDIPMHNVKKGDHGGRVDSVDNLSQEGEAWVTEEGLVLQEARVSGDALISGKVQVSGDAWVFGNAQVFGNAEVFGNARVFGNAQVFGDARVFGNARVFDSARVSGKAQVSGDARIKRTKDLLVIGPVGLNRFITITRPDKMIKAGCFHGDFEEFKAAVDVKYKGTGDYYLIMPLIQAYFKTGE